MYALQKLYEATWGWSDKKKCQELKHDAARFIIAMDPGSKNGSEGLPVAYIHFR